MGEYGRIVPPYPRDTCQASDCGNQKLTEETGAYLHTNLANNGAMVVLCGQCSTEAELNQRHRLPKVML